MNQCLSRTNMKFIFDDRTHLLSAELTPSDHLIDYNVHGIYENIKQLYGNLLGEENMLDDLLERIDSGECGVFPIALAVETLVDIHLSSDNMTAYISTAAVFERNSLTLEKLQQHIGSHNIAIEFCDMAVLQRVLEQPGVNNLIFAEGKLPINGLDAKFLSLLDDDSYLDAGTNKSYPVSIGRMDFVCVDIGMPVMRKVPATQGVAGYDVMGKIIPAQSGSPCEFSQVLDGTVVDSADSNLLIASVVGHPVLMRRGVRVSPFVSSNNPQLYDLKNIGRTLDAWLKQVGVKSYLDLLKIGPAVAYVRLSRRGIKVTRQTLCSLYGALTNKHRDNIGDEKIQVLFQQIKLINDIRESTGDHKL